MQSRKEFVDTDPKDVASRAVMNIHGDEFRVFRNRVHNIIPDDTIRDQIRTYIYESRVKTISYDFK